MPAKAGIGVFGAFSSLLEKSEENTNASERSEQHCLICLPPALEISGANLSEANLCEANLCEASLPFCKAKYPSYIYIIKRKNMLPVKLKIFISSLLILLMLSCSKPPANNNILTCSISYTISNALSKDQEVQYLAGNSGAGGTISSVSYLDSAGTTTVQNPVLPLTVYVDLKKGQFPTISAKGTANPGGAIIIYITADSLQNGYACSD
jgi:Pentapeptide repeats (8 copies)